MWSDRDFDVLVSGAGPVGMATALQLADLNVRVSIIDKDGGPASHNYACVLHPETSRILEELGLGTHLERNAHKIDSVGCYEGEARCAEFSLASLETHTPYLSILPQSSLEEILEEELARRGVPVHWWRRLGDLEFDSDRAWFTIDSLTETGKGYAVPHVDRIVGRSVGGQAAFVIGADGRDSHVRQMLGIRQTTMGPPLYYHIYDLVTNGNFPDELRIVLHEGTINLFTPLSGTSCRWMLQVPPEDLAEEAHLKDRTHFRIVDPPAEDEAMSQFLSSVQQIAPWFHARIIEMDWHGSVPFEQKLANSFGHGRCWLVGDAAHTTTPIGMHSMNVGIHEGTALAHILSRVLAREDSTGLLDRFNSDSRKEWEQLFGLGQTATPGNFCLAWARKFRGSLLSNLPVSGAHLESLLGQVGLQFKPHLREVVEHAV
jgi:2-polyprenyl-6-methoxyphenol hydroxylase-like FAD-dependent oxidoreductase